MSERKQLPSVTGGKRAPLLLLLVANGLAQATTVVITSLLIRYGFDRLIKISGPPSRTTILWIALGLFAAGVSTALLRMRAQADAERLGQYYAHAVRMVLFDRLVSLAPRALQRRSRGGLMLRFVGDLTALRRWVSLGLARSLVASVCAAIALVALSQVNLALAASVGVILGAGASVAAFFGKPLQEVLKESRRRRAYLATNVNEKIASAAVVQVFGQGARERRRIARQGRRLREAMIKRARIGGRLRGITEATAALAVATALYLGAGEVASGRATPGTVVAAMVIVRLLLPSFRDLGRILDYWHSYCISAGKIKEFINTPSLVREIPGASDLSVSEGRVAFHNITVKGLFQDLNVTADPGTVVAIIGPNGAGKSTLLALAARLIEPDGGAVLIDGQDLKSHSLASVRRAIGMVSPDLLLLRGTVEKNLRYRWPDAPEEELACIRELCGIDEIVARLPEGAQTRLIEGGANLSLGERQRIALARALLGNPPILLLDEAEANSDFRATRIIDGVLRGYSGTILMVTHQHDRLARADTIWHLAGGRVVETGPPSSLLRGEGPTAQLLGIRSARAS